MIRLRQAPSIAVHDLDRSKIELTRKLFTALAKSNPTPNVRYVADSYSRLMQIVGVE